LSCLVIQGIGGFSKSGRLISPLVSGERERVEKEKMKRAVFSKNSTPLTYKRGERSQELVHFGAEQRSGSERSADP
jgi:hypothetical protein